MTALLAATIVWCLAAADDDPASDCGFTEAEVACLDTCSADDDHEATECPPLCFTRARINELRSYPLYEGK